MKTEEVSLKNISEYVSYLIYEFYKNNLEPFFNALDDDVVWIGPNDGQFLHTSEVIRKAFKSEEKRLTYTVGPIYTEVITHGKKQCDTVSFFKRTSYHPDGKILPLEMVYHLSWVKKEKWKMSVISLTIRLPMDSRDSIYPNHIPGPLEDYAIIKGNRRERLLLHEKGTDNIMLISPDQIEWAESDGHFSIIHFNDVVLTVSTELKKLAECTKDSLIQCHASYLINPYCIRSIARFSIQMTGGKKIPVPEKKYTAVKKKIIEFLRQKS